jgi:4-hydroxybenzoyl-CoA thioesterase
MSHHERHETVRFAHCDPAVSRIGDVLTQRLVVQQIGRSSMHVQAEYLGGGELRLRARQVLACTSLEDHRPRPIPDDVRAALRPYVAAAR